MRRSSKTFLKRILAPSTFGALLACGVARGDGLPVLPIPATAPPSPNGEIKQVQQAEPAQPAQPARAAGEPGQGADGSASRSLSRDLFGPAGGEEASSPAIASESRALAAQPTANVLIGEQAFPFIAADLGTLIGTSESATGLVTQKRQPIVNDPRVRGYHVGQTQTWSDGAYYMPARQDLDTAVSKLDASLIQDVVVLKGPYTVRYGPGFAFLNVDTVDSPRYANGLETHGLTSLIYQTNGQKWNGRQNVAVGSYDWGFRGSYGIQVGRDYSDGLGFEIPSSFGSQDFNYAIGANLTCDSRIELKGLRLFQSSLEFAGQEYDLMPLQTNGYAVRYILGRQQYFDTLTIDAWYNRTNAYGNTNNYSKQLLLKSVFNQDINRNFTNFTENSKGTRFSFGWGENGGPQLVVGADLTYYSQYLLENLISSPNPVEPLGGPFQPYLIQLVGIPESNSIDPGIFAEMSFKLTDNFTLKPGIRGDWVRTNSASRNVISNTPILNFNPIIFSINPTDPNLVQNFDMWSTYLTGDYKLNDNWKAIGGFGFAQRPPTLTELYAAGSTIATLQQGLNRTTGDPHLQNEQLYQIDLGVQARYDAMHFGANAYCAWVHNYITYNANRLGAQTSQVTFANTEMARLFGFELYGDYDVLEWLTPFGTLGYVQGSDQTRMSHSTAFQPATSLPEQEPLPAIPPLEARVGLRLHQPGQNQRWAFDFSSRLVDNQFRVASSLAERPTPGFTTYDLRSYWRVMDGALLTAGVENIGDRFYREHLDPRAGNQMWRQGRNFYFGMQFDY